MLIFVFFTAWVALACFMMIVYITFIARKHDREGVLFWGKFGLIFAILSFVLYKLG